MDRQGPTAHRRWSARLAAVVVGATLLAAGCSSGSGSGSPTTPLSAPTAAAPAVQGPFAVGRRKVTFVDGSRPTSGDAERNIPAASSRTLPVNLLYPADGTVGAPGSTVDGAEPAPGRFPLVVFAHGVTANGDIYTTVLARWARAGYIVAAPTFPMTSGPGAWADLGDYVNQPADVSFLIDRLSSLADDDPLHGHVDAASVAVAGHSLGAITTLGFYNSCCRDDRVSAAVALSGALLPFGKSTWDDPPDVPLLLVHGVKDETVPYGAGSARTFSTLQVPRALVTLPEADHVRLLLAAADGHSFGEATTDATVAFLDLELRHDDRAWKHLGATLDSNGQAWIEVAGGLARPGAGGRKAEALMPTTTTATTAPAPRP